MDAFEKARVKFEKNRIRQGRQLPKAPEPEYLDPNYEPAYVPPKVVEIPEKKMKATPTIRVMVGGYDYTFNVPGLFGNLSSSAASESGMREVIKQALESKFGKRIECLPPS